ncbi:class I SAM-dependent methyltransferase, partial [Halorhodospira neutriphila]
MEQLQTWYRTPLGQRIGAAERRAVAEALRSFGIGDAVWVGGCPGRLRLAPTLRQWQAGRGGDLVAEPTQLPFRGGSLEALILGHVLDVGYDAQAVLHEALQVLRPEGRLVVLTFNPFGLWGAARLWGRLRGSVAPWRGPQWPAGAVVQRLRHAGFEEVESRYLGFRPPATDPRLQERFDGWERWGQ